MIKQVRIRFMGSTGVLKDPGNPKKYAWEVSMQFYRFDGDTLTGRIDGTLTAKSRPPAQKR